MNSNQYEEVMADIKEILEAELHIQITRGPVMQMFIHGFSMKGVKGNLPLVLYVTVPDELSTITLNIMCDEGIDYPNMVKVISRLNLLNRLNIVGHFVLGIEGYTFSLKKIIALNENHLNKTELRWTFQMLLYQVTLYFESILDCIESGEIPDPWLKKRWPNPSYLHESCK